MQIYRKKNKKSIIIVSSIKISSWRDGSVVRSLCYFCRRLRLHSHTYMEAHNHLLTPFPGNLMPYSELHGQQVNPYIVQAKHSYAYKIKQTFKVSSNSPKSKMGISIWSFLIQRQLRTVWMHTFSPQDNV